MASIFTFEPDPPRVASPWHDVQNGASASPAGALQKPKQRSSTGQRYSVARSETSDTEPAVPRLQAEPQEGPVEYKLHLLLRPRRKFKTTSTSNVIAGSRRVKQPGNSDLRAASETATPATETGNSASSVQLTKQTRQLRLEQLTTQLLWRLQQSSPHHTSSATNIILPSLPEALPELQAPQQPAKLLHGLEESQGALYEIGVSDDGTLVGLTEDEMEESLNNLRAMAACLGCKVDVLRHEVVGECQWIDDSASRTEHSGSLFVAEAHVTPCLQGQGTPVSAEDSTKDTLVPTVADESISRATEQLRITLAGPTMSGKSTLLGTLTTSTLDNGRGSSRLSMLKHRHEITSGITSSVTQELFGYQDNGSDVEVVNYATENIASWIDVHAESSGSRLVFVSDSAGHPRYRRTTVRGLVGWAPHWTLLCVPADDTHDTSSRDSGVSTPPQAPDLDLSGAQLDLCLRLGLPLVVVITKLDLASRNGLKGTLSKLLDALKAAGRKPAILPSASGLVSEEDLRFIKNESIEKAYNMAVPLLNDVKATVPIVLTSALQGSGINTLHALLHELPIVSDTISHRTASSIFDIEDVYTKPADVDGVIISGRLRQGQVSVGDKMVLGPFSTHTEYEDSEDSDERPSRRSSSQLPASRSFPGALRDLHLSSSRFQLPGQEWKRIKVLSIRNLRLPVAALQHDQVGTLAVAFEEDDTINMPASIATTRIRKGMVLTAMQPISTRSFVAEFSREDLTSLAIGNHVVVYIASVRASAKVVSARVPDSVLDTSDGDHDHETQDSTQEPFEFDGDHERTAARDGKDEKMSIASSATAKSLLVTLRFDSSKEFVLVGDRVLIMPGGGPGLLGGQERGQKGIAGLDGYVGKVVEVNG
jgi:GTPase